MYEYEFVDEIEEGKEYKLGVLYEFIEKHRYHLYSETIGTGFLPYEQRICIISKVINKKYQYLCNKDFRMHINNVEGIIFAEYK
ncbi:MAG: hypothetical protein ACK5MV_06100 [Aminipila sp.]